MKSVQLTFANWNDVCDIVPSNFFVGGVYLDDNTLVPLESGKWSSTIGLTINTPVGKLLMKENGWIIRGDNGEICFTNPEYLKENK